MNHKNHINHIHHGLDSFLAPENACSAAGFDKNTFELIWQYGTAENGSDPHPTWERDGVALQCAIPRLDWNPPPGTKHGRIRFQGQADFVQAHVSDSYGWIINKLEAGDNGYVQPRN